jgi:hypothetical protein
MRNSPFFLNSIPLKSLSSSSLSRVPWTNIASGTGRRLHRSEAREPKGGCFRKCLWRAGSERFRWKLDRAKLGKAESFLDRVAQAVRRSLIWTARAGASGRSEKSMRFGRSADLPRLRILRRLSFNHHNGTPIRLRDIGQIRDGFEDIRRR